MATIKTKEWLRIALDKKNMTQKQLAESTGVSVNAISKIIRGERLGSAETWEKIENVLNFGEPNLSHASGENIEDLRWFIRENSGDELIRMYYHEQGGHIIFIDYITDEELEKFGDSDLVGYEYVKMSARDGLKLFEKQNRIL